MIPVLGVPILTKPELLDELLATIDVEVGRLVIIDNGGVIGDVTNAEVVRPGRNIGVAASWNHVFAMAPEAPWWMIVGFDITFAPGDLTRLVEYMDAVTEPTVALLGTFSVFGINRAAIETAGTFDENFHPAYFEDNDYDYRCRLTGVTLTGLPSGLQHRVSSTILARGLFRNENDRTFPRNAHYYRKKWGGSPRAEGFDTPFDAGGSPAEWELEPGRVEELSWKLV